MAANIGLFEEDRTFWFYVDTCQVNESNDLLAHSSLPQCRAWLSLHPLFSACLLLGAYLLTTYTYKRMRLLTRVYGIEFTYESDDGTHRSWLDHVHVLISSNVLHRIHKIYQRVSRLFMQGWRQRAMYAILKQKPYNFTTNTLKAYLCA